ncbi:hypothetical protein F5877DRAFT_67723 [Lentinula edodes]|nr:hypothetical protein F5877DRAFT_67723 [Lentinula edodes]
MDGKQHSSRISEHDLTARLVPNPVHVPPRLSNLSVILYQGSVSMQSQAVGVESRRGPNQQRMLAVHKEAIPPQEAPFNMPPTSHSILVLCALTAHPYRAENLLINRTKIKCGIAMVFLRPSSRHERIDITHLFHQAVRYIGIYKTPRSEDHNNRDAKSYTMVQTFLNVGLERKRNKGMRVKDENK